MKTSLSPSMCWTRLTRAPVIDSSPVAKITNVSEANKFLTREYRPGWEI